MSENLKQAYQMVFNDLMKCRLFEGHYDAVNSDGRFMAGIETAMEVIAERGYGSDFAEYFTEEFANNLRRSEENV